MTNNGSILFHNCRVLRGEELERDELWVRHGRIVSRQEGKAAAAYERVNCHNKILAPGFIDIQINGAFGVDFTATKNIANALKTTSHFLPTTGVTAYVPTIITSAPQTYHERVPLIRYDPGNGTKGASVLGAHLEGPFISKNKLGCHPPELICPFDGTCMKQVEQMYGEDLEHVLMVTLAPEYPGSMEVIEGLAQKGIVVSLGHSESSYAVGEEGLKAGASALTHLFSAMNAFGHREPALPGLICSNTVSDIERRTKLQDTIRRCRELEEARTPSTLGGDVETTLRAPKINFPQSTDSYEWSESCPSNLYFGLIADGVHTHPTSLRIAYRLNRHGLCLITDAISALGMKDGEYHIGETQVDVSGNPRQAIKRGTSILAGVVAPLNECVRYFLQVTQCPIGYALAAASSHPAACLGISAYKGNLAVGSDADLVLLDDDITIHQTWVAGEKAYDKETYEIEEIELEEC